MVPLVLPPGGGDDRPDHRYWVLAWQGEKYRENSGYSNNLKNIQAVAKKTKDLVRSKFERFWLDKIQHVKLGPDGQDHNKLRLYKKFKGSFKEEPYLSLVLNRNQRCKLSRMRISTHHLQIEKGRWTGEPVEARLCKYCIFSGSNPSIDNEVHFALKCPTFF